MQPMTDEERGARRGRLSAGMEATEIPWVFLPVYVADVVVFVTGDVVGANPGAHVLTGIEDVTVGDLPNVGEAKARMDMSSAKVLGSI